MVVAAMAVDQVGVAVLVVNGSSNLKIYSILDIIKRVKQPCTVVSPFCLVFYFTRVIRELGR
jgi:hypothetical protein